MLYVSRRSKKKERRLFVCIVIEKSQYFWIIWRDMEIYIE